MFVAWFIGYFNIGLFFLSIIIFIKLYSRRQVKQTAARIRSRELLTAIESQNAFTQLLSNSGVKKSQTKKQINKNTYINK
jgi:hypothetical protein